MLLKIIILNNKHLKMRSTSKCISKYSNKKYQRLTYISNNNIWNKLSFTWNAFFFEKSKLDI